MNLFKAVYQEYIVEKSKLTDAQVRQVRSIITKMSEEGKMSSEIIAHLQNKFSKLSEKWKAERAFWTEKKRIDATDIKDKAEDLDFERFRILPNTGACPECIRFSNNGKKIFNSRADMVYKGRPAPPIHPGCYCLVLPVVD